MASALTTQAAVNLAKLASVVAFAISTWIYAQNCEDFDAYSEVPGIRHYLLAPFTKGVRIDIRGFRSMFGSGPHGPTVKLGDVIVNPKEGFDNSSSCTGSGYSSVAAVCLLSMLLWLECGLSCCLGSKFGLGVARVIMAGIAMYGFVHDG